MLPNRVFLDFFVEVVKLFSSVKVGYFAVSPFGLAALAWRSGLYRRAPKVRQN